MTTKIYRHAARHTAVWRVLLLGVVTLGSTGSQALSQSAPAVASAPGRFDIAAGPLTEALMQFGHQSGYQVSADTALVAGRNSAAVSGNLPPLEALSRLLSGTGLRYRLTGPSTATLESSTAEPAGVTHLGPVQVEGSARDLQSPTGPGVGYIADRTIAGTKTDTPLLEQPQAISVVGRDQIQAQNAQTLVQALHYTPGVAGGQDPVENRFDSILIRGFQPILYLDGMQLPYGTSQFGRPMVDPFSLSRIEVLRGPSSALYGAIPPGGLVNMVSLRPTVDPVHMVDLQGNNFGQMQAGFDFGGAAGGDGSLTFRLTGLVHGGGTQVNDVDDRRIMIAPAFTWKPDADTSFTFLSQYQQDRSGVEIQFLPAQGTLRPNPHGTIPVGTFVGDPNDDSYRRTQYWVGYQFEHRFNDTWTVRQNLRYANVDTSLSAIIGVGLQSNLSTLNRLAYYVPEKAQDVTLDNAAEAHFATGPFDHTALFGVDYRWASSQSALGTGSASSINIFAPVLAAAASPIKISSSTSQDQNQIGTYVQDQIALDHWRLTLSGRHDWVSTETRNLLTATSKNQDDAAFSGRAGLNYVFDMGLSPYVSFAHSFQPTIGTGFAGTPFQPTTANEYEVGIKYQPLGTHIVLNAAAFTMTETNALTTDPQHIGFQVQTAAIRSRGIELDATASLAEGLNVIAAYTYTDAINTAGAPTTINKQVIDVPRHAVSIWGDYTRQEGTYQGLGFGGGVRYFGATFGDAANTLSIPGYTLVDATIHYDLGQIRPAWAGAKLALNATNLFNTRYVSTCTSLSACYFGTARTVMVDLRYNW